jgi:hypothetical protein
MFMWPTYDPGGELGASLGKGISTGLNALAEHKIQQMHEAKLGSTLEKLGYPKEWAPLLAQIPGALPHLMKSQGQQAIQNAWEGKPNQTGSMENAQGGLAALTPQEETIKAPQYQQSEFGKKYGMEQKPWIETPEFKIHNFQRPALPQQTTTKPAKLSSIDQEAKEMGLKSTDEIRNISEGISRLRSLRSPDAWERAQQEQKLLDSEIQNRLNWLKDKRDFSSKQDENSIKHQEANIKRLQYELDRETKFDQKKHDQMLKDQAQIDKENLPYIQSTLPLKSVVSAIEPEIKQMEKYLATGNVAERASSKVPDWVSEQVRSDESLGFEASGKSVVAKVAPIEMRGPMTKFKLQYEEANKPNIHQPKKVQKERLKVWKDRLAEMKKIIEVKDRIIQQNGEFQPRNLEGLVDREIQKWKKAGMPSDEYEAGKVYEEGSDENKKYYSFINGNKTEVSPGLDGKYRIKS